MCNTLPKLILWCLCWFVTPMFAQQITMSEPYTLEAREDYIMVGRIKDTSILLLYEEDKFRLLLLDENFKQRFSEPIRPERNNIDILKVVPDKHYFTLFYRFSGNGRSSTKAMRISSQGQMLDSLTIQSTNQWGVIYQPNLSISEDRSKLLVYDLGDNNTLFNAVVFDIKTFKNLWIRPFRPSSLDYHNSLHQGLIDNNGGVYWVIERDNRKSKIVNNRFEIIYYTPDLSQEWNVIVPMAGKLWQKALFSIDNKNQKLIGAGFCSSKKPNKSDAVFYFKVTPLFQGTTDVFYSNFQPSFLQQITGKEQSNNNAGFEDFEIRQFVVRNDGGIVLVAEHYKKYVRYSANPIMASRGSFGGGMPMDTRTTTDYEYNDLLLVSIQSNGQKNWNVLLPKRQASQDDDGLYSSCFILKTKTGLKFLYNDEIKTGGNVNEYALQIDGTAQRRNIFNAEKKNLELIPIEAVQISSTEVILPSLVRNKLQLVQISY